MNSSGLQNRLLFISLIPVFILGALTFSWFTYNDLTQQQLAFSERSKSISNQLADTLSGPVSSKSKDLSEALMRRALNERDARSVRVYDSFASLWLSSGPNPIGPRYPASITDTISLTLYESQETYRYLVPIFHPDDFILNATLSNPIAWVELEFDNANTRVTQYQTILFNLLILLFIFAIITVIALYLNRTVIDPVHNMIRAVGEIREGNLEVRVPTQSKGELRELEEGINAMAETIKDAYNEMQTSVDQATFDLRETLETIEIQNIELDMARRDAQQANQVKTEFLANMSHEIRTPLNGIIGFARLLTRSNLTKKQEDYISTILSSSQVLLTIINDVLDFCKIEAGKLMLDQRSTNLRVAIEEVCTMLAPTSQPKTLEIVSLFYDDVPEQLVFDPLRVKQVLTNLISNAIKFTPEGSIVIRTMIEQQKGNKVIVRVSITDTGIGLTKKQQKALFQAFAQADSSTAREFGGTGLGLVISKRLVEQMGGDIGLESEKDKGSTFWFNIKSEVAPAAQQPPKHRGLEGCSVGVIEPREMSRLALNHQIAGWGGEVQEYASTKEMLIQWTKNKLPANNLVIIDIAGMTDTNDVYKHIIHMKTKFHCKVLVLTSSSDDDNINTKLLEKGADYSLTKPIRNAVLYQTLIQILKPESTEAIEGTNLKLGTNRSEVSVLAVDDNSANLKLIAALLESLGILVTSTNNGEDAVGLAIENDYDLIFMDIQMPNMDGLEATRQIRRLEATDKHVPIIALTAHALAEERDAMMAAGMDDYLAKPIDEDQLQRTLFKWTGALLGSNVKPTTLEHESEADSFPPVDSDALTEYEVVDLVSGLEKANGKLSLAKDMFAMLIDTLAKDQEQINNQYQQGDYKALLELVHRLHGASAYCGVPRLKMASYNAETILKQGFYAQLEDALFVLNDEINNIVHWSEDNEIDSIFDKALKVYAHNQQQKKTVLTLQ
ncbi:MAG: two-component system sensor histidine kinase BarA [Reinekea sp.]|jgi:two-component system sensor histidine kinase BarA|uniref:response regulator n=2 Tax=Reinekea sp. TaxID=1970455 RepID=UPI0039895EE4